eukprot:jgi/Galph1/2119/GphlegSOOS_G780.1
MSEDIVETEASSVIEKDVLSLFPGLTVDQIIEKSKQVQRKAVESGLNYRCVESLYFLRIVVGNNPFFSKVKARKPLTQQTIVEIGCGFGLDIRYLLGQGVPKENILGTDVSSVLIELGFELFHVLEPCFRVKSVGDNDFLTCINSWINKPVDLVTASQVLHVIPQYNEKVARDVFEILKPSKGMFIGVTLGMELEHEEPFYFERNGDPRVAHTKQSLTNLLQSAGFESVNTQFLQARGRRGWISSDGSEDFASQRKPLAFIAYVKKD